MKIKPYTETLESDGRPDEIIARASWFNHLKRNNSIITDLMHGQYKSKIICPTCGHVSITFDPFLTCTLPLPTKEKKKTDFYFIFADNHKIPVKIEVWFKKRNHFISNLKDTVIEEMKNLKSLTPKSFNFYFLSNSSLTKVHPSTPTNEVSKKRKMGNLFAVEIDPELLSAPESEIVEVPVTFNKKEHYYSSYYTKRPFTFVRPMHFLRTDTTNDIHLKIFKYFRFFFEELLENIEEKEEFNKLNDLEAYAKLFGKPDERPYDILLSTNARSYMSCFFCGEYRCENCKLSEKDDETLDDLLKKIKTKEFTFEMEVYWPNISNANIEIGKRFNKYDKLNKEDSEEEKQGEEKKNFEETKGSSDNKRPFVITKNLPDEKNTEIEEKTLAECFKLFSEPETLNADNAWYCSVCKEHKEATKEMKIYKAPKYFILHLKRFKGGESILSSGKISTKINFPVILDLTDYVLNHEVPTDYKPIELDPEILNKKKDIEKISIEIEEEIKKDESPVVINKNKECPAKMEEEIMENENLEKNGKKLLYRLYAISNHYGSVGFGHYTAFGLHPKDNNWYCFDDSSVNKVTEDQIVTSAAYILFYEKIYDVDEKICDFQISVPNPQGENQNHNNVGEINSNFLENACLNSNSLNVEGENIIEQNVTDIDVSGSPEKEREEILEEEIKTAGGDEED